MGTENYFIYQNMFFVLRLSGAVDLRHHRGVPWLRILEDMMSGLGVADGPGRAVQRKSSLTSTTTTTLLRWRLAGRRTPLRRAPPPRAIFPSFNNFFLNASFIKLWRRAGWVAARSVGWQ